MIITYHYKKCLWGASDAVETLPFNATQICDDYRAEGQAEGSSEDPSKPGQEKPATKVEIQTRPPEKKTSEPKTTPMESTENVDENSVDELDKEACCLSFQTWHLKTPKKIIITSCQVEVTRNDQLQAAAGIQQKQQKETEDEDEEEEDDKAKPKGRPRGTGMKKPAAAKKAKGQYFKTPKAKAKSKVIKSPMKASAKEKGQKKVDSKSPSKTPEKTKKAKDDEEAKSPTPMKTKPTRGKKNDEGESPPPMKAKGRKSKKEQSKSPSPVKAKGRKSKKEQSKSPSPTKAMKAKPNKSPSQSKKRKGAPVDEPDSKAKAKTLPKKGTANPTKVKATFARRMPPKKDPMLTFHNSLRAAFESEVESKVRHPSKFEDTISHLDCSHLLLRQQILLKIEWQDPFWAYCMEKWDGEGVKDLVSAAVKWAREFLDEPEVQERIFVLWHFFTKFFFFNRSHSNKGWCILGSIADQGITLI